MSSSVIAENGNSKERGSSQEINCTTYSTCAQCAVASNCSWLIEKQTCSLSNLSLPPNLTVIARESCLELAVKTLDADSIQVTVTNIAVKSVKTYFDNSKTIACEVEKKTYSASINNGIIACDLKEKVTIPLIQGSTFKTSPLFIRYFSIVVDRIRLQFNDPRDHYVSYSGCPDENCAVGFWESGSRKYYCKWCLKNRGCQIAAEQQGGCDVRNAIDNERVHLESTIEVKSPDVTIASFVPEVLLCMSDTPTVVSITVKNHWILADGRSTEVTVAGQKCVEPITVDSQTVNCTIMYDEILQVAEGPVQVEYVQPPNILRLSSAQTFRFVNPTITDVSPVCVPTSGGTRIEVTGEHLNVTDRLRVNIDKETIGTVCDIVALARDRIDCVTQATTDGPRSGTLMMIFNEMIIKFYRKTMFVYVADPTVQDGQMFTGVASGGVPLTVRGGFQCTENPQMYVYYNRTKHYGHCALHGTNDTSAINCWPPKLDCPSQMTSLPLGFQVDLAGKTVHLQPLWRYLLYPDPVYTDFEVLDNGTVRVSGAFSDPLLRRQPDDSYLLVVTFRGADADGNENYYDCTVTHITENYVDCLAPFDALVADVLEIAIAVSKQIQPTTVYKRHKQYHAFMKLLKLDYIVGSISCLMICVFTLIFCVKKMLNNSKQHKDKVYLEELRNITAGIDDNTDY